MSRFLLLLCLLLCCCAVLLADSPKQHTGDDIDAVIPLRPLVSWLSAGVQYDAAKHEFTVTAHGQTVKITVGAPKATVNGTSVPLRVPVMEQNGTTLVPLRFFATAFNAQLSWDAKRTVATLSRPDIKKPLAIPIAKPIPVVLIPKPVMDIFQAAAKGDLATTQKLVTKYPALVNVADANGMTPLLGAAVSGQAGIVKFLLTKKANVHAANSHKQTALHLAARSGSEECVKYLLAAGASVSALDFTNDLPLHYAATTNHLAVAKLLLTKKVGLNAKDHDGDTPLRCAIKAKQREMATFLRGMGGQ